MNDMNEYKINLHTTISRIIEKEENSIHNYKVLPKNKIRRKKSAKKLHALSKNYNAFILNLNLTAMVPALQRCDGIKNAVLVQHIMHAQSKAKHFQFEQNNLLIEGFTYGLSPYLFVKKELALV